MKKYSNSGIALLLMIPLLFLPGQALADKAAQKAPLKEYILSIDKDKASSSLNAIAKIEKRLGVKRFTTLSKYTGRDYYVLKLDEAERNKEKQLMKISQTTPGVNFSQVTYRYLDNTLPNDPEFPRQWCHSNLTTKGFDMASDSAWDLTIGSRDVVVAVIDTGVDYLHPDLAPNMWINTDELNGQAGVDDDNNGYVDDVYTHCAGIIGAVGNNDLGVVGVNWQAKIMGIKGFDENNDNMSTTEELEAYDYLLYMKTVKGVNIVAVNASYGFTGEPDVNERDGIAALGEAGILFIAAAGNDTANNDSDYPSKTHYPSSYPLDNIIAVAATDESGGLAYFSNYGKKTVDLGAPGDEILSTIVHSVAYEVDPETALFYDDFESGAGNFTLQAPWAVTEEQASSGTHALSDSPGGNYELNADVEAVSQVIDLSGVDTSLALGFKARYDISFILGALEVWFLAPEIEGTLSDNPIVPEAWSITQDKAASGASSWTDSPDGDYENNTNQWLLSPVVDLSSAPDDTEFRFKLTGDTEAYFDELTLYFSGDGGKTLSDPILIIDGDHSDGWEDFSAVIPAAYRTDNFRALFVLTTDGSMTRDGYYLDDFTIASGGTTFFSDDVENGMGDWREPPSDAVVPSPVHWEKAEDEVSGDSEGEFVSCSFQIDKKYFWDGFQFKFVMHSGGYAPADGVYIDDVGIGIPENVYGYENMSGTSMATPQVTGAAALVASYFTGLSAADIKARILDGAVPVDALDGKTVTGRHLNLFGALSDLSLDTDGDTIPDYLDNCSLTRNTGQRDTDNDGFGNMCDCDLNNDKNVDLSDFTLFRSAWGTTDPDADFDGNGNVDLDDFSILRSRWGTHTPFE